MIQTYQYLGQLKAIAAIAAGTGQPVAANAQQYGAGFRIMNGSTLPAGTCDGCAADACFTLNTINLTSFGLPNVILQSPHPGSENWITWQPDGYHFCSTPIQNRTWGEIKGLYR